MITHIVGVTSMKLLLMIGFTTPERSMAVIRSIITVIQTIDSPQREA